ncbi:MAG TPA: hypothetical protein VFI42_08010, partial [Thermomicrobiaceae bacterium]|nr:hypothetical protein [Thermomicrobiaceae bacterium]
MIPLDHQALIDQRGQPIQNVEPVTGDRLGRFQLPAAGEDCQAPEKPLLLWHEQIQAPLDGGAQRLLPPREVAGAAGQKWQSTLQPLQERHRREELDARCRQFDREWDAIQPANDLGDSLGVIVVEREAGLGQLRPL